MKVELLGVEREREWTTHRQRGGHHAQVDAMDVPGRIERDRVEVAERERLR
jgi:hypothetical protein